MHIVLTNDDGFDAPGLRALWEAAASLPAVEISIVAPATAFSGKGHAVSPRFSFHRVELEGIGEITVVDGTPGDCVRAAVALPGHRRPDWVLSGINYGSNLGIDVFYSGTVAAAREAAILGIPAVAISQLVRSGCEDDWARTTRQAAAVLAALITPEAAPPPDCDREVFAQAELALRDYRSSAASVRAFWNVNLPRQPHGERPAGVRVVPVSTDPLLISYEHSVDDAGRHHLAYTGKYHERPAGAGTDVATAFGGSISISAVRI